MGERESRTQIASEFASVAMTSLKHQQDFHLSNGSPMSPREQDFNLSNGSPTSPREGARMILCSRNGGTGAERSANETREGHHDQEIDRPERRDRLP